MKYLNRPIFAVLFFYSMSTLAQNNAYDKVGMQAMMKGDYKSAVSQLEKASTKTPNDANVLKMLGYSYFQCGNYENSISTYSQLITLKPSDYSAYYYRGKARQNVANDPKESLNNMRDNFYLSAIADFTKAIELHGEEDTQLMQNRGLAYKDYGIYKSYKIKKAIDKKPVLALFNSSIADFQKVLLIQPQRKDILSLIDYVNEQIKSLK
jgi:tetratricopeptide (TPR) repeat protein